MRKIDVGIIIIFFLLGLVFVAATTHEMIHILQHKADSTSICYFFADEKFAHVTYKGDDVQNSEVLPTIIELLIVLWGGFYIGVITMKMYLQNKRNVK